MKIIARALLDVVVLFLPVAAAAQIAAFEFPPAVQPSFAGIPLDGGRTQAITVHPRDANRIVIATQWGGFWKTDDGTAHWRHLDGLPAVFAVDVVYSPDGATLVATIARDNQTVNGGGIYVSRDDGNTWTRPATAVPPSSARIPARPGAWGVSFAPDIAGRIYAGTDYGVATSSDNGATWTHTVLDPTAPVDGEKLQDAAFSLLALPGDRAIAASRSGVFMKTRGASTWTRIRGGNFAFANSWKLLDVSPLDADNVFILQDYNTLLLFEVGSGAFTALPLPGGGSRGPFVRVSRSSAGAGAVDLWVGAGVNLLKATRRNITEIRSTAASDWRTLWRGEGLHDDSGFLGLDGGQRPALYGSDGGVFRPTNPEATMWTRAALPGSRMNSFQMTDLMATNALLTPAAGFRNVSLYFATQDNAIWASPDEGATWPNNDCAEGFHIRGPASAFTVRELTIAYGKVGCGPSGNMLSGVTLTNQRAVGDTDTSGAALTNVSQAFFVGPNRWVRWRTAPGSNPEIFVSEDNAVHWRKRAEISLQVMGVFQPSLATTAGATPTVYAPLRGVRTTADGRPRDGLIRLDDAFGAGVRTFGDADLIYLPGDGSLGTRATEFDWHSVYAVDPRDPNFIIAPDIINGVVKVSGTGGATWITDTALTNLVTDGGRLMMYDDEGHMQVTHIAFDPYNSNRILVGTRDAGIIYSTDHAGTWRKATFSERALYVTGFGFKNSSWPVYASTYGRGLWRLVPWLVRPWPIPVYCTIIPCLVHLLDRVSDPAQVDWASRDVVVFTGGHVNGITLENGAVKSVSVTPGAQMQRYNPTGKEGPDVDVVESEKGTGFAGFPPALDAAEKKQVVNALVFEGGKLAGVITSSGDFAAPKDGDAPPAQKQPEAKRPYLFASTNLPTAGVPVLGPDNVLHLWGRGFLPPSAGGKPPRILIDGVDTDVRAKLGDDGAIFADVKVSPRLAYGKHVAEAVQETPQGVLRAEATFVKAPVDDFDKKR